LHFICVFRRNGALAWRQACAPIALACASACASAAASAQVASPPEGPPGAQIQRLQQRQVEAAKALNPQPSVLSPAGEPAPLKSVTSLPVETPCFPIREVVLEDNEFQWLARFLQPIAGQCVGKTALKQIQDAANSALIERGYVTSRLLAPAQSLQSGRLTLRLLAGLVGHVRAEKPSIGAVRMALPTSAGALLNQRDIDQGLENIRRLQSQADAMFELAPGANPWESELVLRPGAGKRWHAAVGVDNAGLNATGKTSLFGSFTYDSPLHLYDELQLAGTTNANFGAPGEGNRSALANYSVPIGYALLTASASRSKYKQSVPGFEGPVLYSGVQSRLQAGLSAVVFRNAQARTEVRGDLYREINSNTYDGVDLPAQTRDVLGYALGVSHRQYIGDVMFSGGLAWRASLPGWSRNVGMVLGEPDFDGKTEVALASAGVQVPFKVGDQPFTYRLDWNTQNARTPLTPASYFAIGTRYSVRGFNQQTTLAAESGWVISNELDWYAPTVIGTQAIYGGIDAGRIRGPAAEFLTGQTLVGAVLGMRGQVMSKSVLAASLNYDISVGWPLSKPEGISGSPTFLFQISSLF
jgi:hemolysin activation/secretion protein